MFRQEWYSFYNQISKFPLEEQKEAYRRLLLQINREEDPFLYSQIFHNFILLPSSPSLYFYSREKILFLLDSYRDLPLDEKIQSLKELHHYISPLDNKKLRDQVSFRIRILERFKNLILYGRNC